MRTGFWHTSTHSTRSTVSTLDMVGEEARNRILQSRLDGTLVAYPRATGGSPCRLVERRRPRARLSTGDHGAGLLMLKPFTIRFCSTACAEANAPDIMDITCLLASVSVACPGRTVRRLAQAGWVGGKDTLHCV